MKRRVLLFAEAVTLAHVARPLVFARALDADRFDVAIATDECGATHVAAAGVERLVLHSIDPTQFVGALAKGRAVYDQATLQRYVEDDLRAIDRFRPDLIVGDFRLSLSISARLAKVPYASLASAYWSPHYQPRAWPVPVLPVTRMLPLALAQPIFGAVRPIVFRFHCRPLNETRRHFGLPELEHDLRRIYTDADYVLYSDLPGLFRLDFVPGTHRFLGPLLWEPAVGTPTWWDAVPDTRPNVYVTLGSSGDAEMLPAVVSALATLQANILVATAGRSVPVPAAANVFVADYLPGLRTARRSQLAVCNGGSLTAYQALAAGVPVLGIAGNLDQFLNMQSLAASGVGALLRGDRLSRRQIVSAAAWMLEDEGLRAAAGEVAGLLARTDTVSEIRRFVDELLG